MAQKRKIKLIGWDLDGTILDNFELHYQAMQSVFKAHKLDSPTKEDFGRNIIPNWQNFYKIRGIEYTPEKIQAIFHQTLESSPVPQIFQSAKEALEFFKNKKVSQTLITHATPEKTHTLLRELSIENFFLEIFAGLLDKESALKKIIQEKKLYPEEIAYVGDTPGDIEAANNLGVISIAFTKGFAPQKILEQHNPVFMIDDHKKLFDILDL